MSSAVELLQRYLRQRAEFGEEELFLDRFTAADLSARLAAARPRFDLAAETHPTAGAPQDAERVPAPRLVRLESGGLEELRARALECTACGLCQGRGSVVFGEGNPRAEVLVVGEAPGAEEDRSGRPFVGKAGKLLDLLLGSVGFPREEVYICNVLKCRPPANRNPQPEEVEACSPFLRRQVELIRPRAILAFGTFAAQTLLGSTVPIGRLRGQVHQYEGVALVPTYHPAALLRNPAWVRPVWDDLQRLRDLVDRG